MFVQLINSSEELRRRWVRSFTLDSGEIKTYTSAAARALRRLGLALYWGFKQLTRAFKLVSLRWYNTAGSKLCNVLIY